MNIALLGTFGNSFQIFLLIGIIFVYFAPTMMADKHNRGSVFMLNLFLGWTFIGWVIALVMAFKKDPSESLQKAIKNSTSNVGELEKLIEMKNNGSITEEEFLAMKKKLI